MLLQRAALFITACATLVATTSSQIIVNEIMQNPESVGDTDGEWFELYNAGSDPVDIDGWTIHDDGSNTHTIRNGGPLLVTEEGFIVLGRNADPMQNGNVPVSYEYGSAITLGNGSDQIVLLDAGGIEVDRVAYDDGATFPDPTGASMELIHYRLDNSIGPHWLEATTSWASGDRGTPGQTNSRFDSIPPALVAATAPNATLIRVSFSEPVDEGSATTETHYQIVPDIGTPIAAELDTVDHSSVQLTVSSLRQGTVYTLIVTSVSDVAGNVMERDSVLFQLAEPVLPGDIIITEIMKDPAAVNDGDGEWFEVYNRSVQTVDLAGWEVTDGGSNSFTIQGSFPVPSGAFGVFAVNTDSGSNGGMAPGLVYDWGSSGTFTLGNGDDAIIIRSSGVTIDSVSYDSGTIWPDPTGASIGLSDFSLDNNNGTHWTEALIREPFYSGSQGDAGSPGTLGSNQSAGASPSIIVTPDSISHSIRAGEVVTDTLMIYNTGGSDLIWEIATESQTCGWVLIGDTAGVTAPAEVSQVLLTLNGETIGAGVHTCDLLITSNDSFNPLITIPVTLDVSDTLPSALVFIADQFLPIPAGGDTVEVSMILRNPGTTVLEADVWLDLDRPDSLSTRLIIAPKKFMLASGDSIQKVRPLGIPAEGPAGTYTLILAVGAYPDSIVTTSSFVFDKTPGVSGNPNPHDAMTWKPDKTSIAQSYPNPFNPSTTIRYNLKEQTWVTITVYDLLGEVVRVLVNEPQGSGGYAVVWNGTGLEGHQVSTGMYFYTIVAGSFTESKRMLLVR